MRTIRNTFTALAACAVAAGAGACGGSPEPTGGGEIGRAETLAAAEAAPLTIDTPEMRRLLIENAWQFETETLEVECWGEGPNQSPLLHGEAAGRAAHGSERGVHGRHVPGAGQGAFGYAAELADVARDDRLSGTVHTAAAGSAARSNIAGAAAAARATKGGLRGDRVLRDGRTCRPVDRGRHRRRGRPAGQGGLHRIPDFGARFIRRSRRRGRAGFLGVRAIVHGGVRHPGGLSGICYMRPEMESHVVRVSDTAVRLALGLAQKLVPAD